MSLVSQALAARTRATGQTVVAGYGPKTMLAVSYPIDEGLWQERIVLCRLIDGRYINVTPDGDLIVEALVKLKVRRVKGDGRIPGVSLEDVYRCVRGGFANWCRCRDVVHGC